MAENQDLVLTVETSDQVPSPCKTDKNIVTVEKKKRRGVSILKVALLLLRRRSRKSNATVDVASKGLWNRLVGSMRPLHLQDNQSPEKNLLPTSTVTDPQLLLSPVREHFEDVFSPPFSPVAPKSSSSSDDSMSRYASAVNLQDLDQSNDEDDGDDNKECDMNMNGGDEMIDAKAEEFIAQFYAQMRLQQSKSVRRYNAMIKRSIG